MAFKRIKGSDRGLIRRDISATAFAVGDILDYDRTNAIVVTASATSEIDERAGIVTEATTTSDTTVLLQRIMHGDQYLVDTLNVALDADNYKRCIWGTGQTLDNSGTDVPGDTGLFMQVSVVGVSGTSTKIIAEPCFTPGD